MAQHDGELASHPLWLHTQALPRSRAFISADADWGRRMTWAKAASTFPTNVGIEVAKKKTPSGKVDEPSCPSAAPASPGPLGLTTRARPPAGEPSASSQEVADHRALGRLRASGRLGCHL